MTYGNVLSVWVQKYLSPMSAAERSANIKQAIGGSVVTLVSFLVFAVVYIEAFGNQSARYTAHTILPFLDSVSPIADTPEIALAKQSHLPPCPSKTIDQMVSGYIGSPRWNSGKTETAPIETLVNVEGDVKIAGKKVRALLQFGINDGALRFQALEFNGVPQSMLATAQLFQSMCEAAPDFDANAASSSSVGASPASAPETAKLEQPAAVALVQETNVQKELVSYLLNDYVQDAGIDPILRDCSAHMKEVFKIGSALYRQRAANFPTKSLQQEMLARADTLMEPDAPLHYCIVRSVRLLGHNAQTDSADSIRAYIADLSERGLSDLREQTDIRRAPGPGDSAVFDDGSLRNIEFVTLSDLFQLLRSARHDASLNGPATPQTSSGETEQASATPMHVDALPPDARKEPAVRYTHDDMASRFGNTVVTSGADGRELGRTYYDADGNVIYVAASGSAVKATWNLDADQLCITPADNPAAKRCALFHGPKKVGDVWKSNSGQDVTYVLQGGRP